MLKNLQKNIIEYPDIEKLPVDTAGKLMVASIPVVAKDVSIGEIEKSIEENIKDLETINYIYVVNEKGRLVGVLSIKDLFRLDGDKRVSDVVYGQKLVSVTPETDQEHVALLALKHSIKSVPVTNKKGQLLGIVPSDVILSVLNSEGVEDLLKFAGINNIENYATKILKASTKEHFKKRLPWLIVGLFGGLVAAFIVDMFEETLREEILLAAFIPLVVYMADAVGAQTQTIFVRSIALDREMSISKYVNREIKTGFLLAIVLSLLLVLIAAIGWQSLVLSLVLGISLFATIVTAIGIGVLLPWAFDRKGYDPAITSGPFATIVCDMLSVLIYLCIAFSSLHLLS